MKPLENLVVLEFSTMITASFAAMMMADQGARVIKVEPIEAGDPMRYIGTAKGGISALFANCNRGKESVRINLKATQGQQLIADMIESVDVLIHNFRPGVMDALNLGSERLRGLNPRLVYTAISGFGLKGPLSNAPAYDPIIQAHAGMTASQGVGAPAFVRNLMCDKITAYTACQAVTAALYVREKSGAGQHIDLSMLDAGLFFIFPDGFMNHTLIDDDVQGQPLLADLIYQLTQTRDGAITFSAATDAQRNGMLKALGKESLLGDERFNSPTKLVANRQAFREELNAAFLTFGTEEILDRLAEQDVPAAKCHSYDEVLNQPQVVANGTIELREHPLMGKRREVKSPPMFGGQRLPAGRHAPAHGEHTRGVLAGFGIPAARLDELDSAGVIK